MDEVERAKRFAADQVALGLIGRWFLRWKYQRVWLSPRGADFDRTGSHSRSKTAGSSVYCRAPAPLHHSHVGGVFETEDEIVRLLDALGPDVIGVGLGHWTSAMGRR